MRDDTETPAPYWVASPDAVKAGYPIKTVPIPVGMGVGNRPPSEAADVIAQECLKQQNEMLDWLDGKNEDRERLAPKYDGTLRSLAECYEHDEDSAYQQVQENTAEGYKPWLKMVKNTVGERRITRIVAKDFRRWYRNWKAISNTRDTTGTRQAYGGIQILRIILNYGIECGYKNCVELRTALDKMKFSRNPPRDVFMTFAQVRAFIDEAWRRGEYFMALVQAIQFECFFRQNDVIGKWRKTSSKYLSQPGDVVVGEKYWRGMTIEMIRLDDVLKIRTSKTGKPVVHALSSCHLIVECLAKIGKNPTAGPVARRTDGRPWPDRKSFGTAWREIARAAKIPDNVWNMDNRASAITEASEAGVRDDDIIKQTGHPRKDLLEDTYKRGGAEVSKRSNAQRQQHRETGDLRAHRRNDDH
jgi:hypothetical protein